MSFQKCPICNGAGNDPFVVLTHTLVSICPTCKGTRIIDEVTGFPPIVVEKHNIFESVDPCNADVQNAFICNPEYRKADLKATADQWKKELSDEIEHARDVWREANPDKLNNLFNAPAQDV